MSQVHYPTTPSPKETQSQASQDADFPPEPYVSTATEIRVKSSTYVKTLLCVLYPVSFTKEHNSIVILSFSLTFVNNCSMCTNHVSFTKTQNSIAILSCSITRDGNRWEFYGSVLGFASTVRFYHGFLNGLLMTFLGYKTTQWNAWLNLPELESSWKFL